MSRRRIALASGTVALVVALWLGGPRAPTGAPSMEDAASGTPGAVVAWDPESRLVVFEIGGRLTLDRLIIDRSPYLELPMPPRWRVTGDWFSVPASSPEAGRGGIAPGDVGCWCARAASVADWGVVHLFGRFPVALAGRVAQVALERPGEVPVEAIVVGERGFLVVGVESPVGGRVTLLDAAGRELGTIEVKPADG